MIRSVHAQMKDLEGDLYREPLAVISFSVKMIELAQESDSAEEPSARMIEAALKDIRNTARGSGNKELVEKCNKILNEEVKIYRDGGFTRIGTGICNGGAYLAHGISDILSPLSVYLPNSATHDSRTDDCDYESEIYWNNNKYRPLGDSLSIIIHYAFLNGSLSIKSIKDPEVYPSQGSRRKGVV